MPDPSTRVGPRIYALDLARLAPGAETDSWLDHAAGLGFDHVLLPVPFAATRHAGERLLADPAVLHPAVGSGPAGEALADLARRARARGLGLLLDVVLDRIDAHGRLAGEASELFAPPDLVALPDPRHPVETGDVALARLDGPDAARRLAEWWGGQAAGWAQSGVAGLRLMGLRRVPSPALHPLLDGLRLACPGLMLIAWTPGIAWEALAGLGGTGLDFAVPSLPWWDWHSDWLWQEIELLGEVAPLLVCPQAPDGPEMVQLSHHPVLRERQLRRAVRFAAGLGSGWMLPMGLETGHGAGAWDGIEGPVLPQALREGAAVDFCAEITRLNAAIRQEPALRAPRPPRLLAGSDGGALALLRADAADARRASQAALLLANADAAHRRVVAVPQLLSAIGGEFTDFRPLLDGDGGSLDDAPELGLAPGEVRLYRAGRPVTQAAAAAPLDRQGATEATRAPRIAIEDIAPRVAGLAVGVKRVLGELVAVEADVICDGHDKLGVALQWRGPGETAWQEARMRPLGNDRWQASFPLRHLGRWWYRVVAWRDAFASFRDELAKKHAAGVPTTLEIEEGRQMVARAAARDKALGRLMSALEVAGEPGRRDQLLAEDTAALMAAADDRPFAVTGEAIAVEAERTAARTASWYEIFPRSMSDDPHRHGNFDDVIRHLPRIRAMHFDVLYFPPIHPIGRTNRKGRNNSLRAGPDDPGSPYAIGGEEGGHDALHPELGTLEDFRRLIAAAAEHGLEIAIDFAIQCSPDHPWLRAHKGWFDWRPDGSLRYAENPPKKYEDIVNVDFYADDAIPDLWLALCDVVLFWAGQGVRLFRVDNPHTKPLPFWQWMIGEVRARYPDAIFLAEAFTRPKVMYRLAKVGFSQSYTYFTWRNTKAELAAYFTELADGPPREFFRPHLFVNTPDINPVFLQSSGRAGFLIRAALAATLSGLWGVYSGFELGESRALPGREEYQDSEKYEIRAWDWQRPGNIVPEITRLNRVRALNPALQTHLGVTFLNAFNDVILYYEKATPDRSNVVLIAVSLDPHQPQEADFELPLWRWGLPDGAALEGEDLVGGGRLAWQGKTQRLRLTPDRPYVIWRVRPAA
ncbi:MAG TPA: alpha-1,4-glucan--maltose-1-phosphate maltosyltransferase [Acetobacteraceae bacterium]|nr:alpha-1,4-glucan--maltose-1-phosphate maltosyltransferase [Acetobacteraceae bacterium]